MTGLPQSHHLRCCCRPGDQVAAAAAGACLLLLPRHPAAACPSRPQGIAAEQQRGAERSCSQVRVIGACLPFNLKRGGKRDGSSWGEGWIYPCASMSVSSSSPQLHGERHLGRLPFHQTCRQTDLKTLPAAAAADATAAADGSCGLQPQSCCGSASQWHLHVQNAADPACSFV